MPHHQQHQRAAAAAVQVPTVLLVGRQSPAEQARPVQAWAQHHSWACCALQPGRANAVRLPLLPWPLPLPWQQGCV
jgi:hypothetical protein